MRRFRAAKKRLDEVVDGMIRSRRSEIDAQSTSNAPSDRGDLLSMLEAARDDEASGDHRRLSSEELRDLVLTLFLAGFESIANALAGAGRRRGRGPEAGNRRH